ncbi:hypothetical protein BDQ12DRAFT_693016 [Crucibulum laeve]|uniref:Uncharacterized protein n=1 Tax=Crucibulum laeve TaxID=68775 RepID=A0A5C3LH09_9AGAR|nr:hypothetical protein BDQ12DRAFT_693016 [Crucibulum laeve]
MPKCRLNLSRLPPAPRFKAITFKNQTPGSPQKLLAPKGIPRTDIIDATHPALKLPRSSFPFYHDAALDIRAFPLALLGIPENPWDKPGQGKPADIAWTKRIEIAQLLPGGLDSIEKQTKTRQFQTNPEEDLKNPLGPGTLAPLVLTPPAQKKMHVPMSYLNATSKKRTSKVRVVRAGITRRIKAALLMIVTRGATDFDPSSVREKETQDKKGKKKPILYGDEDEAKQEGAHWILPGWTYIFFPTLAIYRMPYPELVMVLRRGLKKLWGRGVELEQEWAKTALQQQRGVDKPQHDVDKLRPGINKRQVDAKVRRTQLLQDLNTMIVEGPDSVLDSPSSNVSWDDETYEYSSIYSPSISTRAQRNSSSRTETSVRSMDQVGQEHSPRGEPSSSFQRESSSSGSQRIFSARTELEPYSRHQHEASSRSPRQSHYTHQREPYSRLGQEINTRDQRYPSFRLGYPYREPRSNSQPEPSYPQSDFSPHPPHETEYPTRRRDPSLLSPSSSRKQYLSSTGTSPSSSSSSRSSPSPSPLLISPSEPASSTPSQGSDLPGAYKSPLSTALFSSRRVFTPPRGTGGRGQGRGGGR